MSWTYNSDTGVITCTRGDTPTFRTVIYTYDNNGEAHVFEPDTSEGWNITFAIKQKGSDEYLVAVDCTDGIVRLAESDTDLPVGKYKYELSLNNPTAGYHCTYIENKNFIITDEIYNHRDGANH